jgi:hypothetical protein
MKLSRAMFSIMTLSRISLNKMAFGMITLNKKLKAFMECHSIECCGAIITHFNHFSTLSPLSLSLFLIQSLSLSFSLSLSLSLFLERILPHPLFSHHNNLIYQRHTQYSLPSLTISLLSLSLFVCLCISV